MLCWLLRLMLRRLLRLLLRLMLRRLLYQLLCMRRLLNLDRLISHGVQRLKHARPNFGKTLRMVFRQ